MCNLWEPFSELTIAKNTLKPNILGSPDTYNLNPLMKYGCKDMDWHAWTKNTSSKQILDGNSSLVWKVFSQVAHLGPVWSKLFLLLDLGVNVTNIKWPTWKVFLIEFFFQNTLVLKLDGNSFQFEKGSHKLHT